MVHISSPSRSPGSHLYKGIPLTHMNPYHVRAEVQLASGWQGVLIGITDSWEKASLSGARLYVAASARFALPALRIVASVLEEDDVEVPEDR